MSILEYPCNLCHFEASRKDSLMTHLKLGHGDKSSQVELRGAKQSKAKTHIVSVHEDGKFKCNVCKVAI